MKVQHPVELPVIIAAAALFTALTDTPLQAESNVELEELGRSADIVWYLTTHHDPLDDGSDTFVWGIDRNDYDLDTYVYVRCTSHEVRFTWDREYASGERREADLIRVGSGEVLDLVYAGFPADALLPLRGTLHVGTGSAKKANTFGSFEGFDGRFLKRIPGCVDQ